MSKIKLNILLNNEKKEIYGILKDNRIVYSENNIKTIIDLNKLNLIREANEYKIELDLNSNKGIYYLKEYNIKMELEIKVNNLKITEKSIIIEYIIKNDNQNEEIIEYKVNYEII